MSLLEQLRKAVDETEYQDPRGGASDANHSTVHVFFNSYPEVFWSPQQVAEKTGVPVEEVKKAIFDLQDETDLYEGDGENKGKYQMLI